MVLMTSLSFFTQNQGWAHPDETSESDQWRAALPFLLLLLRPFLSLSPSQRDRPARSDLSQPGFDAEPRPQASGRRGEKGDGRRRDHLWDFCVRLMGRPAFTSRTNGMKRRDFLDIAPPLCAIMWIWKKRNIWGLSSYNKPLSTDFTPDWLQLQTFTKAERLCGLKNSFLTFSSPGWILDWIGPKENLIFSVF